MKYIIVLGDGMADEPIGKLGERTPLQAADTPAMDWLAAHGRCGLLKTVPDGYHPGSEIANLSVLGYDLDRVFEGRARWRCAVILSVSKTVVSRTIRPDISLRPKLPN